MHETDVLKSGRDITEPNDQKLNIALYKSRNTKFKS